MKNQMLRPTAPTARRRLSTWGKRAAGGSLTAGFALPPSAYPRRHSHPDCRSPLTLIVARQVDELADLFELINKQDDNPWVRDLMGHFKKLYNSWQIYVTAETMKDPSVTINHAAFTMVGACTPESLFSAMTPRDVEGGFANRPMLLPLGGAAD